MSYEIRSSDTIYQTPLVDHLSIHVSDSGRDTQGWWFQVDVHAEGEEVEGLDVAIYLKSQRLAVGQLDAWGDWSTQLKNLPLKAGEEVTFEARSRKPRLSARSEVSTAGGLIANLEYKRRWQQDESLQGADLRGAHLSGAHLEGIDLRDAQLQKVKLSRANLKTALLCRAQMQNADLFEAQLEGADLEEANLEGAEVEGIRLKGADLRGVKGLSLEILANWIDYARLDDQQKQQVYASREERMAQAQERMLKEKQKAELNRKLQKTEEIKRKEEIRKQALEETKRYAAEKAKRKIKEDVLMKQRIAEEKAKSEAQTQAQANAHAKAKAEAQAKAQKEQQQLEAEFKLQTQLHIQRKNSWIETENNVKIDLTYWREQSKRWRLEEERLYRDDIAIWEDEKRQWEVQNKKLMQRIRLGIEVPKPPERPVYHTPYQLPPRPPVTSRKIQGVEFNLIAFPPIQFYIGRGEGSGVRPEQKITLSHKFWITQTLVTQSLWLAIMGKEPSWFKGNQRPVENISWWQAADFCNRLSSQDGLLPAYQIESEKKITWIENSQGYRLLTDAEWEAIARCGFDLKYPGSTDPDQVGWHLQNSKRHTHEVAQKNPNFWGIYDLSGNVAEWVFDDFSTQSFTAMESSDEHIIQDPIFLDQQHEFKVVRGGAWDQSEELGMVTARESLRPSIQRPNLGLRIARTWGAK
jgi:formylglycine-generating enzyme